MPENQSFKNCVAYCLAQSFDINALAKLLSDSTLIRIIKGALLIEDDQSWSIVFAYGAVVHWNVG
ncbi:MAG: RMD1 family protein, partial [Methylobacter sp.]